MEPFWLNKEVRMSVEAVDKFHEGKHNINSAAGELRELSELFYHVGNEKISKQLNSLSEYLENDVKLMDEAFCDLLLDRVNSTEKDGANVTGSYACRNTAS
jgi:hypothetical protein